MSDMEIEALPGLKQRAQTAYEAALERRAAAEAQIVDQLTEELYDFLIGSLGIDHGTAAAAQYKRGEKSTVYRKPDNPDAPSKDITVETKIEGVRLRASYAQVQVMGKHSDSFGEEKIYTEEPLIQVHNGRGWETVTSLETLGRHLA